MRKKWWRRRRKRKNVKEKFDSDGFSNSNHNNSWIHQFDKVVDFIDIPRCNTVRTIVQKRKSLCSHAIQAKREPRQWLPLCWLCFKIHVEHLIRFRTIDFYLIQKVRQKEKKRERVGFGFGFRYGFDDGIFWIAVGTIILINLSRSCDLQETFHILPCTSTKSSVISTHTDTGNFTKKQLKMREQIGKNKN